jgi:hypothetical protein
MKHPTSSCSSSNNNNQFHQDKSISIPTMHNYNDGIIIDSNKLNEVKINNNHSQTIKESIKSSEIKINIEKRLHFNNLEEINEEEEDDDDVDDDEEEEDEEEDDEEEDDENDNEIDNEIDNEDLKKVNIEQKYENINTIQISKNNERNQQDSSNLIPKFVDSKDEVDCSGSWRSRREQRSNKIDSSSDYNSNISYYNNKHKSDHNKDIASISLNGSLDLSSLSLEVLFLSIYLSIFIILI